MFYCYSKTQDGTGCILQNGRGAKMEEAAPVFRPFVFVSHRFVALLKLVH